MTNKDCNDSGKPRSNQEILDLLIREMKRLKADDIALSLDDTFEPKAGTLLKVEIEAAYWHVMPEEFRAIVCEMPDGAGSEEIKQAIEAKAMHVWHGPSPKHTRSTSP